MNKVCVRCSRPVPEDEVFYYEYPTSNVICVDCRNEELGIVGTCQVCHKTIPVLADGSNINDDTCPSCKGNVGKNLWLLDSVHPMYGKVVGMGVLSGEKYRWFHKDNLTSMIPLSFLEDCNDC